MSSESIDGFSSNDFEDTAPKYGSKELLSNKERYSTDSVHVVEEQKKDYYDFLTTYYYDNPEKNKTEEIPVPVRWHPQGVFKRIVQHNKIGQYTGIVLIGMSGSGKTTLTRMFLHRVHEMGEKYIVKWFTGTDMLNIDKIIQACTPGFPHILIFDDASYTLEDAKKEDVARLANALTTIRHHIKSRVITIMNIHYSKATKKFFRNQHFTFLTSISSEEIGNFQDLFKGRLGVVGKFARLYNNMMLREHFTVPISSYTYQRLHYKTNQPFRVGLVSEISDLHFFLYAKESCATCDPKTDDNQLHDYHDILDKLCYKYGEKQVRTVMQFFATVYEGKNFLDPKRQKIWMHLAEIEKNVKMPLDKMVEEMNGRRQRSSHTKGTRGAKKFRDESVMDVVKKLQAEQEKKAEREGIPDDILVPPTPKKKTYADYDSLYVKSGFKE